MEALTITAHLQNGFAASDPYSPSLEGILAYWHLMEVLGPEEFALGQADPARLVTPTELPLGTEADEQQQGQWWWQCSSPLYEQAAVYLKFLHRRFDIAPATNYVAPWGKSGRVDVKSGPYKAYRISRMMRVTREIVWHAIGDQAGIERLLRRCDWLGASRGQGCGRVLRWTVTPGEGASGEIARFWRPVPAGWAEQHGLGEGRHKMLWGIRPPGRLGENKTICSMPALSPVS